MYLIINTRCLALGMVFQLNASDNFRSAHDLNIAIKQTAVNKSIKNILFYRFTDFKGFFFCKTNVFSKPIKYISPIRMNILSINNKNLSPPFLWDSVQNIMWEFPDINKVKRDLLHEFSARVWVFLWNNFQPRFWSGG